MRAVLLDVIAFSAAVVSASVFRWEANGIIWALWVSSLCVGFTTIFVAIASGVKDSSSGPLAVRLLGGLGVLVFFAFHFGLFHFVHSVFLSAFFPLTDDNALLLNKWLHYRPRYLGRLKASGPQRSGLTPAVPYQR